ncbi:MAG: DUF4097 family beta strand repeat-containing protein, partial [Balneolaceae bacterium]
MKRSIKSIIFTAVITLIIITGTVVAQDQIAVPLSNPGQPGQLSLEMIHGSITVSGSDTRDVVIRYRGQELNEKEREETRDGLRRIGGGSSGFEVTEDNNRVQISGVSPMSSVDFEIMVPNNFSLKLALVSGPIEIENVSGNLEIDHVNGNVNMTGVGGSALVNTVNGNIMATFQRVDADSPMAFSNVNGDIDISLPGSAQFSPKLRTEWGDMFTDFEIDVQSSNSAN